MKFLDVCSQTFLSAERCLAVFKTDHTSLIIFFGKILSGEQTWAQIYDKITNRVIGETEDFRCDNKAWLIAPLQVITSEEYCGILSKGKV